jgi:hypothetical protein
MRDLTSNELEFLSEATEIALCAKIPQPYFLSDDGCEYYTDEAQQLFNDLYDQIESLYTQLIISQ